MNIGVFSGMDDLIREYLVFRGFASTLKAFDSDIKSEKEKAFRPDRILDHIMSLISGHELNGLRDLWTHFENKLFTRLDPVQSSAVTKLEAGLLKLYVVNAIQTRRPDKVKEFFERMTPELYHLHEWRDWFALPFIVNPETHPTFTPYFSRQWQDTLLLSLQNFLSIVFACIAPPKLADISGVAAKVKRLKDENALLKKRLVEVHNSKMAHAAEDSNSSLTSSSGGGGKLWLPEIPPPEDVMDDFFIIAQEASSLGSGGGSSTGGSSADFQVKGLKSFLRNLSMQSSPSPPQPKIDNQSSSKKVVKTESKVAVSPSPKPTAATGGGKTHAPLARVSQGSLIPQQLVKGLKPEGGEGGTTKQGSRGSSVPPLPPAFILLSQEEYREHNSEVTHVKFSRGSGNLIASSDVDGVVKIWSATPPSASGSAPPTLATFISSSGVSALDWIPSSSQDQDRYFVSGTVSGSVRICDRLERKTCHEMTGNSESGNSSCVCLLETSPNGNMVAMSSAPEFRALSGGSFGIYDLRSGNRLEHSFSPAFVSGTAAAGGSTGLRPVVTSCKFNHGSQMVTTGGSDGKIRIFDLRRRDCISSWSVGSGAETGTGSDAIVTIQPSSDDTSVYVLTESGQFSMWSIVQTSRQLLQVKIEDEYFDNYANFPRNSYSSVFTFTGDSGHFVACSTQGGIIYQIKNGTDETASATSGGGKLEKVLALKGHSAHATCTDWSLSTDHGPCVTGGFDGKIKVSTLLCQ